MFVRAGRRQRFELRLPQESKIHGDDNKEPKTMRLKCRQPAAERSHPRPKAAWNQNVFRTSRLIARTITDFDSIKIPACQPGEDSFLELWRGNSRRRCHRTFKPERAMACSALASLNRSLTGGASAKQSTSA